MARTWALKEDNVEYDHSTLVFDTLSFRKCQQFFWKCPCFPQYKQVGLPLDFDLVPDFSRFWGLLFRPLPRFVSLSVTKAFESVPYSQSFRRASSFSKLNFTLAMDKCFPSGPTLPSVTTSISQLSGRDPSNSNVSTSLASGTLSEVVWFISPWKAFICSAILEPSWYLSLTIFWNIETQFTSFLFSNIMSIFS